VAAEEGQGIGRGFGGVKLWAGSRRNYALRCAQVFLSTNRALRIEVGEIIARNAADGLLRSGATIRASVAAFEKHTASAVALLQTEFSSLIPSRGREWKGAMGAVDQAIEGQYRSARHLLERPFTIAAGPVGTPAPNGPSIANAIDDELRSAKERAAQQHAAFSEGWTAPLAKPWHERHPILYALGAAVAGSILTAIVAVVTK
jgi:hypothetical protein